ncbi:MAG: Rieske 2Fe-2S domain-containing protein, partial [Deltaproteobacteria bacterium]|nr:Rieske 2Fe-2S domain-containing protein [Kofleriaceae bacterium]
MGQASELSGPDLERGIPEADLREDVPFLGHAGGEAIVLVRTGGQIHALGATCTHYGGPLVEGRVFGGALHCPWHHACFDLASGRAHGPALSAVPCWDVALEGGTIRVGARRNVEPPEAAGPSSVVIVGGGAAGVACAEALRAEGYRGPVTIVNGEGSDPVDRPNLSKDYLAGSAPEEWAYLRTSEALRASGVEVVA